jgi:NhaA family Na+:H+ antiporter
MPPGPVTERTRRVADPVAAFLRAEAGGGVALLVAAMVALVWANSAAADGYNALWSTQLRVGAAGLAITQDLRHWVNDCLMVVFFFVISLEIKRELVTGDLRRPRAAALPVLAALGGVVVPVVIFLALAGGGEAARGWGVPMATDVAFAIAALAVLGSRVDTGLKLFLVTIAVVDDIVAIAVIAIAYTPEISVGWLGLAGAGLVLVGVMRIAGVAWPLAYLPVGAFVWVAMLESGVHATIAGVALALMTPARPVRGRAVLEDLESRLHPVSSFVVLPLFALANAGVVLGGGTLDEPAAAGVAVAVAVALVAGKFIGISGATFLALKARVGTLPQGVSASGVFGVAALGGIGFTVSLFITPLAYGASALADSAKIGILAGSLAGAGLGMALLARR